MSIPFNPAALIICFRESLEAVIVVAILLQFLEQSLAESSPDLLARLRHHVWIGAASGLISAISIGASLILSLWMFKEGILGDSELWQTCFELVAVIMQT